ncbi:divergent polysaccharide deacetylase family protein [Pseudotabrizicola alkalilacus]|uniref:divergent polysaccharide deacetylase family protein n=1 Tax=Pseudotabrizicola alkalilacus TaxID=2305252 RepID=UPI002277DE3E|nr:divergent polysaccharide deacetylase family protein [Pseudotabrizicola alkalilacus]
MWGTVAAAGGLVVVSQIAGPVSREGLAQADGQAIEGAAPESVTAEAVVPAPVESEPVEPEPEVVAPEPAAEGPTATQEAPAAIAQAEDAPETPAADAPDAPAPIAVTDAPDAPGTAGASQEMPVMPAPSDAAPLQPLAEAPAAPQPDSAAAMAPAPAEPPAAPPSDAPAERMASAGQVNPLPAAPATGDAPMAAAQPDVPGLPGSEGAPAPADLPPPPPLTSEEEALLRPLPDAPAAAAPAAPEPADPTPEPMPLPEPDAVPEAVAEGEGALSPAPGLVDQAPGVVTGRLPRIGSDPAPATEVLPEPEAEQDLPPRQRYARPFDAATQKPLFAILLQDNGQEGVNRAELAALDLPLSIVIDPLSEGAAERAAIWRAGGQEVLMAGTGIPVGAGPGDLEQSFQVLASRLPEAVAVIDPDGNAFQNNRPLATQVVPILTGQGRGLVTFDQGLNAADQVARREGLAAAMIFRSIDGGGEDSPVIRRYLDRAAFKAAQEGRVIVIGALRPETVAAVLEWAVEGRASTVTLAPVSAMLQAN